MRHRNTIRVGLAALASTAFVLSAVSTTAFAKGQPEDPGTPGQANCHGQTMAWINLVEAPSLGVHGEGNVAKIYDAQVKDGQALVNDYCEPAEES